MSLGHWSRKTSRKPTFQIVATTSPPGAEAASVATAGISVGVVGILIVCFGAYICAKPQHMRVMMQGAASKLNDFAKGDNAVKTFDDMDGTPSPSRTMEEILRTVSAFHSWRGN